MPAAFYLAQGDRLLPTELTRGPWRQDAQHGGPPAGLLARAFERCAPRPGTRLVRMTIELLGPVPLVPLEVSAEVVRPGRSVELLEATLRVADGPDLLRSRAWRMRTTQLDVAAAAGPAPPPPEQGREGPFFPGATDVGWHTGMEIRFLRGAFPEAGPAEAWLRLRQPLVSGEEPTALQRLLVAADGASGISSALDFERYVFINTDLSVSLFRAPRGEWTHLDSRTIVARDGTAVTDTRIGDRDGPVGRGLQSLLVAPRGPG